MEVQESSRQVYTARINKVMDYVNSHLDEPIDLAVLADIASFSPYHFHRIFTYLLNETPNNFVSRVRLEKAAQRLLDHPDESVSDIALCSGYTNTSSFCRAFRQRFGVSAKDFRKQGKAVFVKDGIRYSKAGTLVSKIGQEQVFESGQLCPVERNQFIFMETKIEVKQMPALSLIYCRHMGAFDQIGKAYETLFKWAGPRGLVTPNAKTVTVYHDDPSITSMEKVRQDASLIVEGDVKVDGEIGKSTLPGGKYAVGRFELKETEFEKAWNTLCAWFTESGFEPGEGPTYELYHNDYQDHPDHHFIVDICIPVKPL